MAGVAGTGFAAGLRAGGGLVSQALENQRLDEAADRASQEFEWKKTKNAQEQAEYQQQLGFRQKAIAAGQGAPDAASTQGIQKTYGMNADQMAQPDLKARLASYDVPDASELPGGGPGAGSAYGLALSRAASGAGATPTPAAAGSPADVANAPTPAQADVGAAPGLQPPAPAPGAKPFTAADVTMSAPSRKAVNDIGAQAAIARGDWKTANELTAAGRAADVQDITDSSVKDFMAMSPEDRAKRAWSPNLTGNVPLLTTKVDKNGMTVLVVNPDGSTDGKPMKLSWQDAAQLHAAEAMAGKGYGPEAIAAATAVNARIGEAIKAQNDVMQKVATTNTEAAYKGGELGVSQAKLGIMQQELGLKKSAAERENTEVWGATNEGIINRNKNTGALTVQAFPPGTPDDVKQMAIKKYRTEYEPKYSTDGQMMTIGPKTFDRNPNYNSKNADPTKVNTTDPWLETTPGKGGDVATALKKLNEGKKPEAAPPGVSTPTSRPPVAPPAPKPLTQNEQVLQAAAARQQAFDEAERRRALLASQGRYASATGD